MKLVDTLSEGGLCTRGRGTSQGVWGQTQEGDGRNLVTECQWEQIIFGVWVGTSVNCLRVRISSSFCIVNDKLLVSDFSPKKTEPVLFIPKPKPVNSMPTFSLEQQKMVQDFSIQSGRNFQQSQK